MPRHLDSSDPTGILADLREAGAIFVPELVSVETVADQTNLVKIADPAGAWRVRRLPQATSLPAVGFSHEVMAQARDAGLTIVPETRSPPDAHYAPALRLGDRFYDAQRWMPGEPHSRSMSVWPGPDDQIDIPAALDAAVFSQVIAATARLHEETSSIAARRDIPEAPLAMLPGAVRQAHERHLAALRGRARHQPAIQRWLASGERLLAAAEPIVLEATQDHQSPTSVVHLDFWPAHVLFDGDQLTGLLGWDRVAAGSPLLDIAQATLRLQGWSDDTVETAISAYGETRHLSPEERRLLPAVAALDAVAATGRLLEQTYANLQTARPPTALRSAIDMMLASMTALERSLTTLVSTRKSRRVPWRRGVRSGPRREGGSPRARDH